MMMMTMMNSDGLDSSTNTKMSKAEPGVAQTITCSTESVMNVKDLVENEEMFRSQFDRESETYHGGDERQVDIGGDQVPEGMDGEEVIQPSGPVVLTYGKKHDDVVAFRAKLGDVKKAMVSRLKRTKGTFAQKMSGGLDWFSHADYVVHCGFLE
eukprot:TRINITY_DN864_c0_g1_i3.p1 TRINITY_DN864_c0_g1~~TRINITY_DN864_c0_g1_i3.p1  ORF type:complete len:154 (+),score=32.99 TRINITY_DN864_c0_g1_i3:199-660(+)